MRPFRARPTSVMSPRRMFQQLRQLVDRGAPQEPPIRPMRSRPPLTSSLPTRSRRRAAGNAASGSRIPRRRRPTCGCRKMTPGPPSSRTRSAHIAMTGVASSEHESATSMSNAALHARGTPRRGSGCGRGHRDRTDVVAVPVCVAKWCIRGTRAGRIGWSAACARRRAAALAEAAIGHQHTSARSARHAYGRGRRGRRAGEGPRSAMPSAPSSTQPTERVRSAGAGSGSAPAQQLGRRHRQHRAVRGRPAPAAPPDEPGGEILADAPRGPGDRRRPLRNVVTATGRAARRSRSRSCAAAVRILPTRFGSSSRTLRRAGPVMAVAHEEIDSRAMR